MVKKLWQNKDCQPEPVEGGLFEAYFTKPIFTIFMITDKVNILMTGGGAPGAAGILHCLKQNPLFNITMADADPEAIGKYLNNDFETIPFASDTNFVDAILSL